jgi:peptidoglycan LD-endopeptidase CwlK
MTFSLGLKSHGNLVGVHPALKAVIVRAVQLSAVDFGVHDGTRTLSEQRRLVDRGVSKTMKSRHLVRPDGYGHAVDLVPWIGGRFSWADWRPFYAIAAAVEAARREQGPDLVWGGVWDRTMGQLKCQTAQDFAAALAAYGARHPGPDFYDGPHFELAG